VTKPTYISLTDLRGFHRLANDATIGLADLVEAMHLTIVRAPGVLGESPTGRTSGITGLVYKSVRGVTRLVGVSVDALLGLLAPLIAKKPSSGLPALQHRPAYLHQWPGIWRPDGSAGVRMATPDRTTDHHRP
jgi:hypothetical protein